VARLIDPAAKLATTRRLDATTASHSLGAGLGVVAFNELCEALDWLLTQQSTIEAKLAVVSKNVLQSAEHKVPP
jgi:hypothetical protein